MTECLEKKVMANDEMHIIDGATVIKIVTENNRALGVIYLSKADDCGYELVPVCADYVVLATGGAASVYKHSVYPFSQTGAMGLAIEAGCRMNNLTEWQYGIASTKVRWNLSGSYQQVVPTYYSVDENGTRREFLGEEFTNIFLKGYQWPFDSKKVSGSSKIDIAVANESKLGRKAYMDFRKNPERYDFQKLSEEAKAYLINSGAADGATPLERLQKLNPKAIEFYMSKGIDLSKEPLEIAVCAQHINGGIDVDINWQTSVKNLFAVGEAAGTFGMYRPGGSALNSTQVGGLRAAEYISANYNEYNHDKEIFNKYLAEEQEYISFCLGENAAPQTDFSNDMSNCAAHFRVYEELKSLNERLSNQLQNKYFKIKENNFNEVRKLYKYRDNLAAQACLCSAMLTALPIVGSRGGAIFYKDNQLVPENESYREMAVVTENEKTYFTPLRPAPSTEYSFEKTWQEYCKKRSN